MPDIALYTVMYISPTDDFQRLDNAMEAAGMAWWEIQFPSGVVFFADNKATMLGYSPDKFVHYSNFTDLVHPDDYDKAMNAMRDHMSGQAEYYETTYRIKTKHGDYKTFYDRGKIVQKNEDGMRIAGVVMDVAPLKKILEQ